MNFATKSLENSSVYVRIFGRERKVFSLDGACNLCALDENGFFLAKMLQSLDEAHIARCAQNP